MRCISSRFVRLRLRPGAGSLAEAARTLRSEASHPRRGRELSGGMVAMVQRGEWFELCDAEGPAALQVGKSANDSVSRLPISWRHHRARGARSQAVAAYLKHDVVYRLSRFQTGPNIGDWFVVMTYSDDMAYEKALASIEQDADANRPLPRLQSSRRGLTAKWSSISIFGTVDFNALVCLASQTAVAVASADVSSGSNAP